MASYLGVCSLESADRADFAWILQALRQEILSNVILQGPPTIQKVPSPFLGRYVRVNQLIFPVVKFKLVIGILKKGWQPIGGGSGAGEGRYGLMPVDFRPSL